MVSLGSKVQSAYETLSEPDKRMRYDSTARFVRPNLSKRAWREPSYGPSHAYTDPPFWSVELRAMTIQKCARIAKIQHLEHEIQELVAGLNNLVDAEKRAASKENKAQAQFPFLKTRAAKANALRHRDFLTKSTSIHTRLDSVKNELRTTLEDHKKRLEEDNERKTWWARERVRRVEEENRRAATTAAEAAQRRAERAREYEKRDAEAARAAEDARQQNREEALRSARATKVEEERRKRAETAREDPEAAKRRRREAEEWLARQRESLF